MNPWCPRFSSESFAVCPALWVPVAVGAMLAGSTFAAPPPVETFVYKQVGPLAIKADVWRPADPARPRPVLVCLHGGSLINGGREKLAEHPFTNAFLAAGFVVVSLDYRLAPETKLPGIVEDVEDGFRWVREQGPAFVLRHLPPPSAPPPAAK